jgi:hypothetical protein
MNRNRIFDNNCYRSNGSCPKAGIKIHETNNNKGNYYSSNTNTNTNYNPLSTQHNTNNSSGIDYYNTSLNKLDLTIENYGLNDLYRLFNIPDGVLTESALKNAKQIVLKMHPDKSHLDSKYFLFFSKAYKQLYGIYEFQNKSTTNKKYKDEDFYDDSNKHVLNNMFEKNKELRDGANFNKWFNESFEKHRLDNPLEEGYGDWLKSDEGFIGTGDENVTKSNMNEIFEQKKKQIQALSVYNGITDSYASSSFGSSLDASSNLSSSGYTDLRQAYTETLIPVTHEDFERMPKYKNFNDYKNQRDNIDTKPLTKEESERILYERERAEEQRSAALAFKYAQEAEKAKQSNTSFWGDIKRLTGF